MSKIPFMPLYTSDYMGDTRHLSTEQHGAYLLLLMHSWSRGGRLPNDAAKLARIAGLSARRWKAISGDVLAMFEEDGAEIYSKRLTFEHTKATSKTQSRIDAGRRGGQAKALKDKKPGLAKPQAKQVAKPCHLPDTRYHIKKGSGKPLPKKAAVDGKNLDDPVGMAVSDYNAICGDVGLAKCQRITKPRRAKIAARIKTDGLMGWAEACKIVAGSAFCRGEGGTGWRADIDFIASESGFTKIMEGKYDDREITNAPSAVTQSRRNALREVISEAAQGQRESDPF